MNVYENLPAGTYLRDGQGHFSGGRRKIAVCEGCGDDNHEEIERLEHDGAVRHICQACIVDPCFWETGRPAREID